MNVVGIHKGLNGKFYDYMERYEAILDHNGIEHIRLDAAEPGFWEKTAKIDLFIFRWTLWDTSKQMAQTILPIVEHEMGIKCFPDTATCWHYDDKVRQHYILTQHGFPAVKSWIFWSRREALKWIETAAYPLVFKLKSGSASHNVILVKNPAHAERLVRRMFGKGATTGAGNIGGWRDHVQDLNPLALARRKGKEWIKKLQGEDPSLFWQISKNYAYFQEFLPGNEYDTRVVVIGKRAFAFRRFNRKNDFRASGNSDKDLNPEAIDKRFLEIGFAISEKLKFQCMAYDFIYDGNREPRVVEMSYTFPDTTIPHCPGYWDNDLNWNEGRNWAQYFQLMDLLQYPDLKQPAMVKND